jgi:hypothetical protein
MTIWIAIFLFLHVMGAIVAFGPTYSFPIIGKMAGEEPQHANFAARMNVKIAGQRVEPLAVFVFEFQCAHAVDEHVYGDTVLGPFG